MNPTVTYIVYFAIFIYVALATEKISVNAQTETESEPLMENTIQNVELENRLNDAMADFIDPTNLYIALRQHLSDPKFSLPRYENSARNILHPSQWNDNNSVLNNIQITEARIALEMKQLNEQTMLMRLQMARMVELLEKIANKK